MTDLIVERTLEEQAVIDEAQFAKDVALFARQERNSLLKATDFYALADVTMSAEMATYRQALRDITNQEGFPDNITWPTKPE